MRSTVWWKASTACQGVHFHLFAGKPVPDRPHAAWSWSASLCCSCDSADVAWEHAAPDHLLSGGLQVMVPRPSAAGTAADPPGVGLVFLAFDALASAVRTDSASQDRRWLASCLGDLS